MTNFQPRLSLWTAVLVSAAMLLLSGPVLADPPARVARLGFLSGPVSFSPAGEDEWVLATPNLPLVTGDRLWADAGARVELQAGSIALRLGASTDVNVLNLDDRTTQVELAQGSMYVRVWRFDSGETVEIDTPNLAFTIGSAGRYRIDVDADGNVTTLAVLAGQGEAYGEGAGYRIGAGERYSFSGTGLRDYEYSDIGAPDEFDRWAADRDRRYDSSPSARYVSRDVIGYQDLDQYGTWSVVPEYGNVWYPRSMAPGWAPYRTGRWAWVDPWGWTWVDEAPWGFAPYHYGRWAFVTGRWGWIPGPINVRPVYAPALVAFIGGGDLRLSLSAGGVASGIAWFPLGPGEVYQPAYRVSRDYFTKVNVSNTRITNVNITNVYNNYTTNATVTNVTYRNREAPGAVTAVPTTAFAQSQPVARVNVQVPRDVVTQQPVSAIARVAPTRASLVAATTAASAGAPAPAKPPARAMQREIVARTKPPSPAPAFAARQAALAASPDRPVEPSAIAQQRAAANAGPPRNVKLITPTQAAAPAPKEESRRGRGQLERRVGAAGSAQGAPAGALAPPVGQRGAPAGDEAPKGIAPTAEPSQGSDAARRAREGGQRPTETGKGATTESPAQKGQLPPPAPRPPERGAGRPALTPPPAASPEAAKGTSPPKADVLPHPPGGQGRDRNERRGPPQGAQGQGNGGPIAAPPPSRTPEAVKGAPPPKSEAPPLPREGRVRDRNERQSPPEAQSGAVATPPPAAPRPPEPRRDGPPPQAAPQVREPERAREPPQRPPEARREAPPPAPPEAQRSPLRPQPAPPAAQPPRPRAPREAPKAEPKGDQGNDRNKDKDKDKKGSEG